MDTFKVLKLILDIVDIVETYLTLLKTLIMTRNRMTSRDILPGTTFIDHDDDDEVDDEPP